MKVSTRIGIRPACRSAAIYCSLALAAALIEVAACAHAIPYVLHGSLLDPDSYMRLVRIRQGLAAGHLLNVVNGDDSGAPLVIEWSRLFDAAIVALAAPLASLLGWTRALFIAGVATGPLSAGLLGAGIGFAAAPLSGGKWLPAGAIIALLLPGIRNFDSFGIVHYHIAQVGLVAVTIGCMLRTGAGNRAMAWAAGVAGGVSIWLMPETMPFVLLGFGALGYVWLFRPIGGLLARAGAGFACTLLFALWLDPPYGGPLVPEIDRLSIVYATLGIATVAVTTWLNALDCLPTGRRRAQLGAGGAVIIFLLWLAAFPAVALGPFGLIPPETERAFFGSMTEVQPVGNFGSATALLGPAILALIYVLYRSWRSRGDALATGIWIIVAAAFVLAIGLTARMIIFQQYPASLAAGIAPIVLNDISTRLASRPGRAAATRIGLVWLPVFFPYGAAAVVHFHAKSGGASGTNVPRDPAGCSLRHIAPLMRPAAGQIVLTSPVDVPELLYRTSIIGVGSLYQHGVDAYMRAWDAWRIPVGRTEPAALAVTGAKFVLFCPTGANHSVIGKSSAPHSLWRSLAAGDVPPWLERAGQRDGYVLYRISPPVSDAPASK